MANSITPTITSSIAFIDSAVPEAQVLANGIHLEIEVIQLNASRSGIAQITEALQNRCQVAAGDTGMAFVKRLSELTGARACFQTTP